jgi:arginyl-tRNA synthetase
MTDNLYANLRAEVLTALQAVVPDRTPELLARVEVTPTREAAHGDMATNAAMIAAKPARQPPARLAQAIAEKLKGSPNIAEAIPAGPGFVNLRLHVSALVAVLPTILTRGIHYGDSTLGKGERVNVEYVSANPTGPMHIGHCRGAVVGDALANLLAKSGHAVTKEYYINDAGAQVAALAWATYWRYLQALGTPLTEEEFAAAVPGGLQYRGDYLVPVGEALAKEHGSKFAAQGLGIADPSTWFDQVRETAVTEMMRQVRADLVLLGVDQEIFSSERELLLSGAVDAVIAKLDAAGLIYEGILEPPKGRTPDDWEPRPQLLFRATQFADDVDRPLRKSDGSNTYFANDMAYHAEKMSRGFTQLIDVWGADHGGYVSRMKAAVQALSDSAVKLEVVLCQIVHVVRDGQPVRMSKRAGTYITLRDLIDEVGRDAVRFTMLTRKSDAQMEFDLDQAVAQTRENPVFYVQYAHARCRSVLRAASEMFGAERVTEPALAEVALESLAAEAELAVLRRLAAWPRAVEAASQAREPHRIAFFLYDLASDFHMLWNRGKDDAALRFLQAARPDDTLAKLALVAATAVVIRSGLEVLGVTPVEEMR